MIKHKLLLSQFVVIFFAFLIFSCNNTTDVPFPRNELGLSKPVTVPLRFSAPKKLSWDIVKNGGIRPTIKKLDIDALPSSPYDSTGFMPFAHTPAVSHFDFNALPGTNFNLRELPSKPLQFKTFLLAPPTPIKIPPPTERKNHTLSVFDFSQTAGLHAKLITCLLRDKTGFLWIASEDGLFRFDGEHIQTYMSGPFSGSSFIVGLAEDKSGRIWYVRKGEIGMIDVKSGTISESGKIGAVVNNLEKMMTDENGSIWVYNNNDKGVSIIDPEARTYKTLPLNSGSSNAGCEVLQDDNKNVWISTAAGGIVIIDQATNKIKYLKKANGLSGDTLSAIAKDKTGQVWVAQVNGGVDAINIKTGSVKYYNQLQGLKKRYTLDLDFDDKGRLWMGTIEGIELMDPEKGMIKFIDLSEGPGQNLIGSFSLDGNNRMWLASTSGLNIIAQNGEAVHQLERYFIITMTEDNEGKLWVGTDKGIEIIDAQKNALRLLNKSNGLGNEFVQSFIKVNQQIWVTSDGGLDIIDPIDKTIKHTGKKEGLVSDTIYVGFRDKAGNTWYTGPSNGIDLIDSANRTIRHAGPSGGLSDISILDVKQDKEGRIWLATNTGGIDVYDPSNGTVRNLNNQAGLKDTCSKMMLLDNYGRMWIGTDKGIYIADSRQGTLTTITTKQGLSSNIIRSLLEYKGSVIAGTKSLSSIITAPVPAYAGGVERRSDNEWKISPLLNSENLNREKTTSWSTDCITGKGQYLWGDAGITVINNIEAVHDSVTTYITGMNVMTVPQYFINDKKLKQVDTVWTADTFYVKGKNTAGFASVSKLSWDSVTGPYNLPVNLHLPFNQNYVQFQFTQAHQDIHDTVRYSYILEGIDKKWSSVTNNSFTENYLNLPSGNYTFKVSSKGINGEWSEPASFSFTISPPWYKTWWAFTVFAILAVGVLRAYIVYRSRKLQRENRLLEDKIAIRTKQLRQSLDDLKATQIQLVQSEKMASLGELTAGIAHEIQNPLNFINNFSEVNAELIDEMQVEMDKGNFEEVKAIAGDIKDNEQKINHHGKRADAIVKGMLQHSRASSGKKELTDVNALADEYLRLSYHGLRAKDKDFNATIKTEFDESIGKIAVVPQDIGRVLLNLYNNAFYAASLPPKGGFNNNITGHSPTVWVSTKKEGDKVVIRVKDNGSGIPPNIIDKIFQPFFTTKPTGDGTGLGLSLSYDIIKAHGGEINVETKEGEGSEFMIQLPTKESTH